MALDKKIVMAADKRSAFHQHVVEALIESKAIDFTALGTIMGKFGERAALNGDSLVHIINKNVIINCGWPGPILDLQHGQMNQKLGG